MLLLSFVGAAHTYDERGLIVRTIDGAGNGVHFAYDLGGRRIHAETDGGAGQQYEYDVSGNITGVVDGESSRTQYVLDEWGRIVEIKRADGVSEFYRYDYAGNITRSVDGNGNATVYEYNRTGKLSRMTDPMGYSEEYYYNLGNRLCRMRDRNGTEVSYTYNLYGNLLSRKAGDISESFEYTAEGLLKSAVSQGMRYGYEYDTMNRLVRKSASGRTLLSCAYDLNGSLTRQEDVTGKVTEYRYNVLDLMEKVTDNGIVLSEYAYYPDGTIRSLKNGSLYSEYAYDADRNLTGLRTTLGEQVLADNRYSYDHNGNRTQKQQLSGNTCYTYDALNQLAKVEYPSYTEELFYDRAGNRSRRVADGVEEIYQYDPRNRLTEYTKGGMCTKYEYDNAGSLLADDKARYAYDAFNRTEKVETFDGHVQVNRYDAEGLRHELEEDGKLVQFIYRGDEIVAEKTGDNIIRLIRGYDLTASEADWARTYYHYASDEMGSITHVVTGQEKESAEGGEVPESSVLNRYEYDAWGNLTVCEETVPNRFKFNGQQYDPIPQQYYLRGRFYNPVIARFTQEDTYRGDGLNLYAYCRNNPVRYVDPSGHWCDQKERVYQELLKKEGLTADTVDPDTQLRLMAEAANQVRGKIITLDFTPELPDLSEGGTGIKYSPVNSGPLSEDVANSFNGATYTERVLTEDTVMYRVSGGNAKEVGSYMSMTPQGGGLQSQLDLALNPAWGNTTENITKVVVPKGTTIYEGIAAPRNIYDSLGNVIGTLPGGGNQVYIPAVEARWFQ